jgi:predicted dehydrogenase
MQSVNRRTFFQQSTAGLVAVTLAAQRAARAADAPSERVTLGIMGLNGRGTDLAGSFAAIGGNHIAYLCDVDSRAIAKAQTAVASKQKETPQPVGDFRRILDDPKVDALVIAAPDHWHGPATILACAAGKHVYVEKPVSHNPREGELMVAAARKHKRVVQAGTQRRSMPGMIEAVARLKAGDIGRVLFARGWYNNSRPTIGHGKPAPVPEWLDYTLWQGPAPEREYRDNLVHYNWHWFWHWGTGELGNNGIHALDVCRWGLGVDTPRRVSSGGGMYFYNDDQQTPDTHTVTFDFGEQGITWEGRNWHRRGFEGSTFGMTFYGDKGSLVCEENGYKLFDPEGKPTGEATGSGSQEPHLRNFLDCVKSGDRPHADIEDGHKSTLLCHLGNIAYRTGHTLNLDPDTQQIVGDPAALWTREYRPGWEPKV